MNWAHDQLIKSAVGNRAARRIQDFIMATGRFPRTSSPMLNPRLSSWQRRPQNIRNATRSDLRWELAQEGRLREGRPLLRIPKMTGNEILRADIKRTSKMFPKVKDPELRRRLITIADYLDQTRDIRG